MWFLRQFDDLAAGDEEMDLSAAAIRRPTRLESRQSGLVADALAETGLVELVEMGSDLITMTPLGRRELQQADAANPNDAAPSNEASARDDLERRRWVFLVQGRNTDAAEAVTALLTSVGLRVLEWEQAVRQAIQRTGRATPYISDIVRVGMDICFGVVVLFTPDDLGCLHPSLWDLRPPEGQEEQLAGRARQNVVLEAGMALGRDDSRTLLVEMGRVAGFSDLAGRHAVRLDDSPSKRKALLDRLAAVGWNVDISGSRWMDAGELDGAVRPAGDYQLVDLASGDAADHSRTDATSEPPARRMSSVAMQWRPAGVGGAHTSDLVVASVVQVPSGSEFAHDPQGQGRAHDAASR